MRNYQESDYALNKLSPNIVYRFANGKVEITLEDYLKSNPEKRHGKCYGSCQKTLEQR